MSDSSRASSPAPRCLQRAVDPGGVLLRGAAGLAGGRQPPPALHPRHRLLGLRLPLGHRALARRGTNCCLSDCAHFAPVFYTALLPAGALQRHWRTGGRAQPGLGAPWQGADLPHCQPRKHREKIEAAMLCNAKNEINPTALRFRRPGWCSPLSWSRCWLSTVSSIRCTRTRSASSFSPSRSQSMPSGTPRVRVEWGKGWGKPGDVDVFSLIQSTFKQRTWTPRAPLWLLLLCRRRSSC